MRVESWDVKLFAYIEESHRARFQYGAFDCLLFAAGAVHVQTGIDYAEPFRGYDSKVSAYRIVAGYGSLEAMITALLGREPVHPSRAMRGDVVLGEAPLIEGETGECVGICLGTHCAWPKDIGLRMLPRSVARLAWRIE